MHFEVVLLDLTLDSEESHSAFLSTIDSIALIIIDKRYEWII